MQGDFSRLTFDPAKHYSAVRMQQGRVQLDADWNEQMDIIQHRIETEITDFIGQSGAPESPNETSTSFQITVANPGANESPQLHIGPGHFYLAGKLFENEAQISFDQQTDVPGATLPIEPGVYLAYLDGSQRHITQLQDPDLREIALAGPDTATRVQNVWQVKLRHMTSPVTPAQFGATWQPEWEVPLSTGRLQARVNTVGATLENQLYRVEIHTGGTAPEATFKWSRDNGIVAARVTSVAGRTLTVNHPGRDDQQGFTAGQWVELSTVDQLLTGQPGMITRLERVQDNELTVEALPDTANPADFATVRRWDSEGALALAPGNDAWVLLEDEIEVRFETTPDHVYNSGDYWLIPARHLTGTIEWPLNGTGPLPQPARGNLHHYAALALLQLDATGWQIVPDGDLRTRFTPLTSGLLSKAGDTVNGSLRVMEDLRVDGQLTFRHSNETSGFTIQSRDHGASPGLDILRHEPDAEGTSSLFINRQNGNVGIGTTDASQKLTIQSDSFGAGYARQLLIQGETDTNNQLALGYHTGDNYGSIQARTNGALNRALALNPRGGDVGIGTTEPQGKLDVRGDIHAGNSDLYFTKTDHNHSGFGNADGFAAIENAADYDALMILGRVGTTKNRYVRLWDYLQINGGLDVTGKVGIGTANPSSRLTVEADGFNGQLALQGETEPHKRLLLGYNTTGNYGTIEAFEFQPSGPGGVGPRPLILNPQTNTGNSNGYVGISTTAPQANLDVNGNVRANNIATISDIRWKTNIATLSDALDKVTKLRGVQYEWRVDALYRTKNQNSGYS